MHTTRLDRWTLGYVPVALGLAGIVFAGVLEPSIDYGRAKFSIWVTIGLATPAMVLFAWHLGRPKPPLWLWWWLGAFLAYAVHFYFGFLRMFQGDVDAVFAEQGRPVALLNFALTALWALDILVAWASRRHAGIVEALHALTHAAVLAAIFTAAVLFREGVVMWLGIAATALPLLTLLARFGGAPAAAR